MIGPVAAWYLGDVLGDVPPPPTAPRVRLAYKTGTSYGHRDAWAFGYDGRHVVGVWMGRADGAAVPGAFGADVSAPVLFEAFAQLGVPMAPRTGPPPGALTVGWRALPAPLQRFGMGADETAPEIVFPPAGVVPAHDPTLPVLARVAEGAPPFTWLWNGAPVVTGARDREVMLDAPGVGFGELTVIDAEGRAARVSVELAAP